MPTISIGILAYNEEGAIACTIESIFKQDLVREAAGDIATPHVEIIVVPNGCHDRTAEVAQKAIDAGMSDNKTGSHVTAKVCDIKESGKENAWNQFVHDFSSQNSAYCIFMDADIELGSPSSLSSLIECLEENPESVMAGGMPQKHIQNKPRKSFFDLISIGASKLRWGMKGIIAGCLYCGRTPTLRRFKLPPALMGEDSFVRAMIVTKEFTQPDDTSLILKADNAIVFFESYTRPSEILRNKTRRMLEASINTILYTKLWSDSSSDTPAGELMSQWDKSNPSWSTDLVNHEFDKRGYWKVQKFFIYSQFLQLKHHPLKRKIFLLPVAISTIPLNFIAVLLANKHASNNDMRSLWDKAPSDLSE